MLYLSKLDVITGRWTPRQVPDIATGKLEQTKFAEEQPLLAPSWSPDGLSFYIR